MGPILLKALEAAALMFADLCKQSLAVCNLSVRGCDGFAMVLLLSLRAAKEPFSPFLPGSKSLLAQSGTLVVFRGVFSALGNGEVNVSQNRKQGQVN